ncbi:MAG: Outer membrane lipoprotein omp16 precursor [uncultured Aureispira sp.]|uniref:Outer membrane lipoprotein omp16 n=1 Tax=uncultured Aureispira sp. TaxID=1331704 RepID=A0A6S6SWH6_9BACT|nr:MAG: Outer membrane lipoprotein omp16 precursor [uncultured Aureispira sp.]
MNKVFIFTIACIFILGQAYAQPGTTKAKSAKQLLQDAEVLINRQQFAPAKSALEAALKQKKNFVIAYRLLGIVNAKLGKYDESALAYEKLFELSPSLSKAAYFECAQSYMKRYKYDRALALFNLYKNASSRDYKADEQTVQLAYDLTLDREIRSCMYARKIDLTEMKEDAINLGLNINSVADEYLPTLTGDGRWLIFTSNRGGENILMSKPSASGGWAQARSISKAINTPRNEGMAKLTVCGRTIYFSACGWENVEGGCDIFEADFDTQNDFAVVDDVRPSLGLNSKMWDSQPAISCDGKTMYFASNRTGGKGGTDLWMSTLADDGLWEPPVNMDGINTDGDEEAPYIAPDGLTLYFSSNGHPGFGDADIFRTVLQEDKTWTTPANLGYSVNTPFREAGIVISPDGTTAYYASQKEGGLGGLDIYTIAMHPDIAPEKTNVMVDAYVYDAATKEPIENVKVKIGKSGTEKQEFKTDAYGRFFVCLPNNNSYSYILMNQEYQTFVGAEYFRRNKDEPTKKIEVFLVPNTTKTAAKIPNKRKVRKNLSVYFDSGKYNITEIQKEQLERMVNQFEDKTTIKLEVTGFADDVGNQDFNLALSVERAKMVADYLISLGLNSSQVTHEGGGIVHGDIAKHQKRRVEIIISN